MLLTSFGAKAAMLGSTEKESHASNLIAGSININAYTNGICYDAAAFVRYLLTSKITPADLLNINGQNWKGKFTFTDGKKWDGKSPIPTGTAVGFYRLIDKTVFHTAISIGGTSIRAVNGGRLGIGWQSVDLKAVLKSPNPDGSFDYDNTKINVYLSHL
jgi:hypothetical protein